MKYKIHIDELKNLSKNINLTGKIRDLNKKIERMENQINLQGQTISLMCKCIGLNTENEITIDETSIEKESKV